VTEVAAERERGIAIVAALWASAILAVIVASVLQLARADANLGRGRQEAAELGAIVDGAVNLTILAMLAPTAREIPVNGTPVTVPFAGHEVRVSIQDEAGKIDLNAAGEPILRRLLSAIGLATDAAGQLAENVTNWPERGRLGDGEPRARGARFQAVEDLQLVPGMTQDIYRRLYPLVTVYSQTPWIDPAYSSSAVLALFRDTDANAEAALRRLEEERAGLRPPPPSPGVALGHAFTIAAELRTPTGAGATRTAIIRLTGQKRLPLIIYRWS
jgi:general secretion pathway protein K